MERKDARLNRERTPAKLSLPGAERLEGVAMTSIPNDEAVEAASDAFWKDGEGDSLASMRVALIAAAPHLMAEAIRQIDAGTQSVPDNPNVPTGLSDAVYWHEVRDWLETLAGK